VVQPLPGEDPVAAGDGQTRVGGPNREIASRTFRPVIAAPGSVAAQPIASTARGIAAAAANAKRVILMGAPPTRSKSMGRARNELRLITVSESETSSQENSLSLSARPR